MNVAGLGSHRLAASGGLASDPSATRDPPGIGDIALGTALGSGIFYVTLGGVLLLAATAERGSSKR